MTLTFVPLHERPDFLDECAKILNKHWKRSKAARLHSLQKSGTSHLPCSLILLVTKDNKEQLLGHSQLSDVIGMAESCLVESVLVPDEFRGQGLGKILMRKTEEFAQRHGYLWMYLTTHDKQLFYEHIGYLYCDPVVSVTGNASGDRKDIIAKLMGLTTVDSSSGDMNTSNNLVCSVDTDLEASSSSTECQNAVISPQPGNPHSLNRSSLQSDSVQLEQSPLNLMSSSQPPAPPPLPALTIKRTSPAVNSPPPPPLAPSPPPPPPLPPLSIKSTKRQTCLTKSDIVRWDPSNVSWMRKCLV